MQSPEKGSMSVFLWWRLWIYLYMAEMWINLKHKTLDFINILEGKSREPMCKIKVELSVERHPEGRANKDDKVVGTTGGIIIRHEGYPESGVLNL